MYLVVIVRDVYFIKLDLDLVYFIQFFFMCFLVCVILGFTPVARLFLCVCIFRYHIYSQITFALFKHHCLISLNEIQAVDRLQC